MVTSDERQMRDVILLYTKMQDHIMFLGPNATMNMNVSLYIPVKACEGYTKKYYYREVQYTDNEGFKKRKIIRGFDCFLTIENLRRNKSDFRESVMLNAGHLEMLRLSLLPKLEDFVLYPENTYESRKGKLYAKKSEGVTIDLPGNKYIIFSPGLHKYYNEEVQPCLDLYLNNKNNIISMSFQKVLEFMNLIRTFQIYNYACTMINAMPTPIPGYNMYDMSINQEELSFFDTRNKNKRMQ